MNDTTHTHETNQMNPAYAIGGLSYRLESALSWQQSKWLGDHIFKEIDMNRLDYAAVHDLLRDKGPLMMAICLVPDGESRKDHSKRPWKEIEARAADFASDLTGAEVALFGPHFFRLCRPDQMAMLVPGKVLQSLFLAETSRSVAPGDNGSSAVSSPSPAATSPSSRPSSPSGDQLIQIHTSGDASSETPSIEPSLVSAASSSPG